MTTAMDTELAARLNRPLAIGNATITRRLVLAPMTFLGHIAFRELLADFGGYGLLFGYVGGSFATIQYWPISGDTGCSSVKCAAPAAFPTKSAPARPIFAGVRRNAAIW